MSMEIETFTAREMLVYAHGVNEGAAAMMRANVRTIGRLATQPAIAQQDTATALGLVAQALKELADEEAVRIALELAPQAVDQ